MTTMGAPVVDDDGAEASTSPLPLRAGALTGVLADNRNVKLSVYEGCEATSTPPAPPKRGASALQLARAMRRRLLRGHLSPRRSRTRPEAYSVTLTCRSGAEAEVREKIAEFIDVLEHRAPKAGALLALDRASGTGRWHVHALVLLPKRIAADTVVTWWTHLWPRATRPARHGGQRVRHLQHGHRLGGELDSVLAHHFGRKRKGQAIPVLPPLADRITACGTLARSWALVAQAKRVPNAPAAPKPKKRPLRVKKASTSPLPRPSTPPLLQDEECRWCLKSLGMGGRKDARRHGGCCRSSSRALMALVRRLGERARDEVIRLERDGWPTRDALRAVEHAIDVAEWGGLPRGTIRRAYITFVVCRCGRPLAKPLNASTCGSSKCRKKTWNEKHPRLRRTSLRPLFETFIDVCGSAPLPANRAVRIGAVIGFDEAKVNALIRELVKDKLAVSDENGASVRLVFLDKPSKAMPLRDRLKATEWASLQQRKGGQESAAAPA